MIDRQRHRPDFLVGLLLRIYWLVGGGFVSFMTATHIAVNFSKVTPLPTILFWLNAVFLVLARYLDIRLYAGLTADGEPATMRDWRRYAMAVAMLSAGLWLGVQLIGGATAV